MAGKGIVINFLADVKDFLRGTSNVEDALDDVADSLDDVVKEGDQTTEKLQDGFKDLAKAAKASGDTVGESMKKGFKEAEDGVQEFRDEAKSTAKESAASFDGSAESIIDSFQEIAANAFVGFGPAGLVAGLAAAAGIGIATKAFQDNEAQAQASKEAITQFGLSIIESGRASAEIDFVNSNLEAIITNADGAKKKFEDIEKLASKYPALSKDVGLMAQAYAGNSDAIELVLDKMRKERDAIQENAKWMLNGTQEGARAYAGLTAEMDAEIVSLEGITKGIEKAAEIEKGWIESGGEARQARAEEIDAINTAYDDAAGSVENYVVKETGLFDTAAYIDAMKRREKALADYQTALATSGLSDEAKRFLNSQGAEAAATMLQGYASGDQATKDELNRIWTEAADEASGAAEDVIKKTFETPQEAKVNVDVDTTTAQQTLDRFLQNRKLQLQIELRDQFGRVVQ